MDINPDVLTKDYKELRAVLPIAYVLDWYGHQPDEKGRYHVPWRDDATPSLEIYKHQDGYEKAGDTATDWSDDVVGLVAMIEGTDMTTASGKARQLLSAYIDDSTWEPPAGLVIRAPKPFDKAHSATLLALPPAAFTNPYVREFIAERPGLSAPNGVGLLPSFGVRAGSNHLVVPYREDEFGTEPCVRYRVGEDYQKLFVSGSKARPYTVMGDLESYDKVLIVEGESDTWAAAQTLGDEWYVVGLPGVGSTPPDPELFRGKEVAIAFDGDAAGQMAATKLYDRYRGIADVVSRVRLRSGKDICDLTPERLIALVKGRRPSFAMMHDVIKADDGYYLEGKPGKDGEAGAAKQISTWTLELLRRVNVKGGPPLMEVTVTNLGVRLPGKYYVGVDDFTSAQALTRWCSQFEGAWFGRTPEAQKLLAVMVALDPDGEDVDGATVAGLHGGAFILPGVTVGGSGVFLPSNNAPAANAESYTIVPFSEEMPYEDEAEAMNAVVPGVIQHLLAMNTSDVIHPIMAWFAMAPLRTLHKQFPSLMVTGIAGSGKTTTVEHFLEVFSGAPGVGMIMSNTTRYGLSSSAAASNAIPLWIDEYRPGATADVKKAVDQLIRDSYTGASAVRGGADAAHLSRLTSTPALAPLAISGEDYAIEQSHMDRMVRVHLTNRNPPPMTPLPPGWEMFAYFYLRFLVTYEGSHGLDKPYVYDPPMHRPEPGYTPRIAHNLGVLRQGWEVLREFLWSVSPGYIDLVPAEPDLSSVLEEIREDASQSDVVLSTVRTIASTATQSRGMFISDGEIHFQPTEILRLAKQYSMPLPVSTAVAFGRMLTKQYGVEKRRVRHPMTDNEQVQVYVISLEDELPPGTEVGVEGEGS